MGKKRAVLDTNVIISGLGFKRKSRKTVFKIINEYDTSHINTKTDLEIIKEDPKDNFLLNLAVDGNAELIISGDKHLLNLDRFEKIQILSPAEFLQKKT